MTDLIYQTSPVVTLATNHFINVPVVLQFDQTPLISIIREAGLGFTSEFPIYDEGGTYLAKIRGTRVYRTKDGEKAGVVVRELAGVWVCEYNNRTAFEIRQQPGDAFRTQAELYTPDGFFVKVTDAPRPNLFDAKGSQLTVGGVSMMGCMFQNLRIGVLMHKDGSVAIGVS